MVTTAIKKIKMILLNIHEVSIKSYYIEIKKIEHTHQTIE